MTVRSAAKRLRDDRGASTIEFLMTIGVVLTVLLILVQVLLIFVNAFTVNHALAVTSPEVGARGGLDNAGRGTFRAHLPDGLKTCYDSSACSLTVRDMAGNPLPDTGRRGGEVALSEDVVKLEFSYEQDLPLLHFFLEPLGVDSSISMLRSVNVVSQSSRE